MALGSQLSRSVKMPATYEDLLAVPDHKVAEILDGELHVSPRPAPRHSLAASVIGMDVGAPYGRGRGGPGGWWILDEPELHLGKDVLVILDGELHASPRPAPRHSLAASVIGRIIAEPRCALA